MSGLANLKLAALPPVDAVVRTATPTAEAIVERYQQAHDALVAAPIYLRCAPGCCACFAPGRVFRVPGLDHCGSSLLPLYARSLRRSKECQP